MNCFGGKISLITVQLRCTLINILRENMYSSAVHQIELEGVSLSRKGTSMLNISLLWGNILEVCSGYLFSSEATL